MAEGANQLNPFKFPASKNYKMEHPGLTLVFYIEIAEPRLGNIVNELTCT